MDVSECSAGVLGLMDGQGNARQSIMAFLEDQSDDE